MFDSVCLDRVIRSFAGCSNCLIFFSETKVITLISLSCVPELRQLTFSQQSSVNVPGRHSPAAGVRSRTARFLSPLPPSSHSMHSVFKGERESPSSRRTAGPSHRRHVRTIQEVRTTITRIITDVYYEDGKEVERKVSEVRDVLGQEQGRGETFLTRPLLFGGGVTRRARSPWWTARCWTVTSRRAAQAAAP